MLAGRGEFSGGPDSTASEAVTEYTKPNGFTEKTDETPATTKKAVNNDTTTNEVKLAPNGKPVRSGLPRLAGSQQWPLRGTLAQNFVQELSSAPAENETDFASETPCAFIESEDVTDTSAVQQSAEVPHSEEVTPEVNRFSHISVVPSVKLVHARKLIRGRSISHWLSRASIFTLTSIVAAGVVVLAARGVTTLPGVPDFLERYPGDYIPTVPVEVGLPVWANWSHYLNFFFMVLIIRTGLLVRFQQKPPAFFTTRSGEKKISLYIWLHTSIDILWVVNGLIFIVLLFSTGHWARIIPTSWEVFPNAASALLQYTMLSWPTENGWINYNSLQQLMYFTVVFLAAPLAILSGVRMSVWWPENNQVLNRLYPAGVARAIHFPTMLFFVVFIVIHVFLVFTTGLLVNLNHMYAASDSTGWVGLGMFTLGLFVTAGVWWLMKPIFIAPIAQMFGTVTER